MLKAIDTNTNNNAAGAAKVLPRRRKRVSFIKHATVREYTSDHVSLEQSQYFTAAELRKFVVDAKSKVAVSIKAGCIPSSLHPAESLLQPTVEQDHLRGLEHYCFPARKLRRQLSRKAIVRAQKTLTAPHVSEERKTIVLASLSRKLSGGAVYVALETGRLDALRVFSSKDNDDERVGALSTNLGAMRKVSFPFGRIVDNVLRGRTDSSKIITNSA